MTTIKGCPEYHAVSRNNAPPQILYEIIMGSKLYLGLKVLLKRDIIITRNFMLARKLPKILEVQLIAVIWYYLIIKLFFCENLQINKSIKTFISLNIIIFNKAFSHQ